MFTAKVIGSVWATRKHCTLQGFKLLLVKPVDPLSGEFNGEATLAVDGGVDAGPGNMVLVVDEGGSARMILKREKAPVRTVICGIIDQIELKGRVKKYA